jgi:hypothetical protein
MNVRHIHVVAYCISLHSLRYFGSYCDSGTKGCGGIIDRIVSGEDTRLVPGNVGRNVFMGSAYHQKHLNFAEAVVED